jgi:hypothetical protein
MPTRRYGVATMQAVILTKKDGLSGTTVTPFIAAFCHKGERDHDC